ncbi:MAG: class I adenylate-forming enzyme family protein [Hyphomicrobiaceae bacterium]
MLPIEALYRAARAWPARLAVEGGGVAITYRELVEQVDALAVGLQALDPAPQSRVGICAWNTVEHLLALLATFAAGKVWVPLNPRNGPAELAAMSGLTQPSIIVMDAACRTAMDPGAATVVIARPGEAAGEEPSVASLIAAEAGRTPLRHHLTLDQLAAVKFTGGSTGRPKGVMQSLRCWNTALIALREGFGFDAADRYLCAAPITHGTGALILPVLSRGGCLVMLDKARPETILEAFERDRITTTYLTPTMIYMMLEQPGVAERRYPHLKHLVYSGAPMRPEQIRVAQRVFNNAVETAYGQVEAPQIVTCLRADELLQERYLGSVGRAAPLVGLAIRGSDGSLLPPGQTGEIVVSGDLVMNGYLDNPAATAETIVDGWLRTGDLGWLDEDGYLFVSGRSKEMIITGGFNVFPAEVEAALGRHPAVKDCIVFGVDDPKWGEAVSAAVELKDGKSASEADLVAFVKSELDSVKAPKRIHIVSELPRSAVGKVLRREARDLIQAGRGTPSGSNLSSPSKNTGMT